MYGSKYFSVTPVNCSIWCLPPQPGSHAVQSTSGTIFAEKILILLTKACLPEIWVYQGTEQTQLKPNFQWNSQRHFPSGSTISPPRFNVLTGADEQINIFCIWWKCWHFVKKEQLFYFVLRQLELFNRKQTFCKKKKSQKPVSTDNVWLPSFTAKNQFQLKINYCS